MFGSLVLRAYRWETRATSGRQSAIISNWPSGVTSRWCAAVVMIPGLAIDEADSSKLRAIARADATHTREPRKKNQRDSESACRRSRTEERARRTHHACVSETGAQGHARAAVGLSARRASHCRWIARDWTLHFSGRRLLVHVHVS